MKRLFFLFLLGSVLVSVLEAQYTVRIRLSNVRPLRPYPKGEWQVTLYADIFDANRNLVSPSNNYYYSWESDHCLGTGWEQEPQGYGLSATPWDGNWVEGSYRICCPSCEYDNYYLRVRVLINGTWYYAQGVRVPDNGEPQDNGYELLSQRTMLIGDQRNSANDPSALIGHYETERVPQNAFYNYTVPTTFFPNSGSPDILQATQQVVNSPAEKYKLWQESADIVNHRSFSGNNPPATATARLDYTYDANLVSQRVDGGSFGGSVDFRDPWYADDNSDPKGVRNRGTSAIFNAVPYNPNLTWSIGTSSAHKGVLLSQVPDPNNPNSTYYSIRALLTQTISGTNSYFLSWDYDANKAELRHLETSSGYDQKAVVFKQSGATVTARYIGSTITSNTTIPAGTYRLPGTLAVAAGATLTISAGTTLQFPAGANLAVYGKLIADGASGTITFTSTGGTSSGSWGSIILQGSSAYGSNLNNVHVSYGTDIRVTSVGSFVIQNSVIEYMVNGVNCYASSGWVTSNQILYPRDHGIIANSGSTIACISNTITKSNYSGAGIYFGGGSYEWVLQNKISGFNWGFGSIWGSSPSFGHLTANTCVNNLIHHCLYGIKVYQYSTLTMGDYGDYDEEPDVCVSGRSSIKNNTIAHVDVFSYSSVYAPKNYWEPYNSSLFLNSYSQLDYSKPLWYDPWSGEGSTARVDQIATSSASGGQDVSSAQGPQQSADPFSIGKILRRQGRKAEALAAFTSSVRKNLNITPSLLEIYTLHNDTLGARVESFLSSLPADRYPLSAYLTSIILAKQQRHESALAHLARIPSSSSLVTGAKLSEFYINLYGKRDKMRAKQVLDALVTSVNGDNMEIALAQHDYATYRDAIDVGIQPALSEKQISAPPSEQVREFVLEQNSPNPFNPTTVIRFKLVASGFVSLKVYDMLGREMAILVNECRNPGNYRVTWDASRVSSGIYFVRMEMNGRSLTQKLLLTK